MISRDYRPEGFEILNFNIPKTFLIYPDITDNYPAKISRCKLLKMHRFFGMKNNSVVGADTAVIQIFFIYQITAYPRRDIQRKYDRPSTASRIRRAFRKIVYINGSFQCVAIKSPLKSRSIYRIYYDIGNLS